MNPCKIAVQAVTYVMRLTIHDISHKKANRHRNVQIRNSFYLRDIQEAAHNKNRCLHSLMHHPFVYPGYVCYRELNVSYGWAAFSSAFCTAIFIALLDIVADEISSTAGVLLLWISVRMRSAAFPIPLSCCNSRILLIVSCFTSTCSRT